MIGAARWTIFSPYYHLHEAVLADEADDKARAQQEFQEARKWAGVWREKPTVELLIKAYKLGEWDAEFARKASYSALAEAVRPLAGN